VRETSHCNNDRDFTMHNSALRMLIILDEHPPNYSISALKQSKLYDLVFWPNGILLTK
jgi:hypothetical protein